MSPVSCVKPSGRTGASGVAGRFFPLAKRAGRKEETPYAYAQPDTQPPLRHECIAIGHPGEIAVDIVRCKIRPARLTFHTPKAPNEASVNGRRRAGEEGRPLKRAPGYQRIE
ncbi:hypothetical protein [Pseudomonas sp. Marseille-QA0892]